MHVTWPAAHHNSLLAPFFIRLRLPVMPTLGSPLPPTVLPFRRHTLRGIGPMHEHTRRSSTRRLPHHHVAATGTPVAFAVTVATIASDTTSSVVDSATAAVAASHHHHRRYGCHYTVANTATAAAIAIAAGRCRCRHHHTLPLPLRPPPRLRSWCRLLQPKCVRSLALTERHNIAITQLAGLLLGQPLAVDKTGWGRGGEVAIAAVERPGLPIVESVSAGIAIRRYCTQEATHGLRRYYTWEETRVLHESIIHG